LVAKLGNFINRWATFTPKYFEGKVPAVGVRGPLETDVLAQLEKTARLVTEHLEACRFKAAQEAAMDLARAGDKYFDASAPFRTRKTDMAAAGTSINVCIQIGKMLAALFGPFLPTSARRIAAQLNLDEKDALRWPIDGEGNFRFDELPAGHRLGEPQILFKKLEPAPAK
jgi:methionyl-tRNA synthetase